MWLSPSLLAVLLAAPTATLAFLTSAPRPPSSRPAVLALRAARESFAALDRLRARRLRLRPRPPEEEARHPTGDFAADDEERGADLEYLRDEGERGADGLFHLLLLPSTFGREGASVERAAESVAEVLGLSPAAARDVAVFARHQGFGRLGTGPLDALRVRGAALRARGIDVRVVPFHMEEEEAPPSPEAADEDAGAPSDDRLSLGESSYLLGLTSAPPSPH